MKILRIDVKGVASNILKSATKTIRAGRPHVFLEAHNMEEVNAFLTLEKLGYKIIVLPGSMYISDPNNCTYSEGSLQ